jgi:threonine aldolase
MDGARFANAVIATGASPADLSWRAGVDVMSFGGTKNGCLAAEAVVFFNRELVRDFEYRRKRAGHLLSKMRFIAAQFDAYLDDGLWLRLASHANAMGQRLSSGLAALNGVEISYPTQINEVFAVFPDSVADRLREAGAAFYPWVTPGDPAGGRMNRLIASFRTTAEEVDRFVALVAKTLG